MNARMIGIVALAVLLPFAFWTSGASSAPVAYWNYDVWGQNPVLDQEGTNHVTLGTSPHDPAYSTDDPFSSAGHSLDFDDTHPGGDGAGLATTASLRPADEFTLATWVKLNSLTCGTPTGGATAQDVLISNIGAYGGSGGYQLLFDRNAGGQTYLLVMYRDAPYADRGIGVDVSNWATDTWYHVAGTYDEVSGGKSELKLYVDGNLRASDANVTGQIVYNNTPNFYLGTNYDGDGGTGVCERELNGHLDDTKVFDSEQSDSQVRQLALVTQTWQGGNGNAADPAKWAIPKIPSYSSICVLPDYGAGNPYTVTVNSDVGGGEIYDMTVNNHATAKFDGYHLTVDQGGTVYAGGKVIVKDTTFTPAGTLALHGTLELDNATVDDTVNTYDGCLIVGRGTIPTALTDNRGTVRAEGGQLQINLASATHNHGTLGAATGGTLYISNNPSDDEVWNKDTVALTGGTLKGYDSSTKLLNYAAGNLISGYGRIQNFNVYVGEGTLTASGGQLQIDNYLYTADYTSTVNVQSGATLHVPDYAWDNRNALNLNGGSITGQTMTQNGTLSVTGTGTIQNVTFNYARTHRVENGATLAITGSGSLVNATISKGGAAGYFQVAGSAIVSGSGVIQPDVTVAGTQFAGGQLLANSSGNTLNLTGSVENQYILKSTGGGVLDIDGTVANQRWLSAEGPTTGGTTRIDGVAHNYGSLFANGKGTLILNNTVNNYSGGEIYAAGATAVANVYGRLVNQGTVSGTTSGGTVNLHGAVDSSGTIQATNGYVNVLGTLGNGAGYNGTFRSQSGEVYIQSTLPSNLYHVFESSGGQVRFKYGFSTSQLTVSDALRPRGGTITLDAGQTLTHVSGKTISGYGCLLESGRDLANQGMIGASNGTLTVRGTIKADPANNGGFTASNGTLQVIATLESGVWNTFTANALGTVRFPGTLSTGNLSQTEALRPRGGTVTLAAPGATLTNAAGKTISGYGTLLSGGSQVLDNQGTVEANGGALNVYGTITNANTLSALAGSTLGLFGDLTNNGQVATTGTGRIETDDATPSGSGAFFANTGGTILVPDKFTNAGLFTADALHLAGGKIALRPGGAPTMTNAVGKVIQGYGTLLDADQTLDNQGLLAATGAMVIGGNVINSGETMRADAAGESFVVAGTLTNNGLVDLSGGASLSGAFLTGGGIYSLSEATLSAGQLLSLAGKAAIEDNDSPSTVSALGNLLNSRAPSPVFDADNVSLSIYSPRVLGPAHQVQWLANDAGAELRGLDDNMALGLLTLGDGKGEQRSDTFNFDPGSILYCYGLRIESDAFVDLGGGTIYYLRDGAEHNGLVGTGFVLKGEYENGRIIEIVPEPSTWALLAVGGLAMLLGRMARRKETNSHNSR